MLSVAWTIQHIHGREYLSKEYLLKKKKLPKIVLIQFSSTGARQEKRHFNYLHIPWGFIVSTNFGNTFFLDWRNSTYFELRAFSVSYYAFTNVFLIYCKAFHNISLISYYAALVYIKKIHTGSWANCESTATYTPVNKYDTILITNDLRTSWKCSTQICLLESSDST